MALRLPLVFGTRGGAIAGGLASYGINIIENYRRAAVYVDLWPFASSGWAHRDPNTRAFVWHRARRLPRGVKKTEYAARDYFDVWLPDLAPSAALLSWAQSQDWTPARWTAFARRYRREMRQPQAARLLSLLAALSRTTRFSVGCYCEDGDRCHRAVLRDLLEEAGAQMAVD